MEIKIDTKRDSPEDIRKAINLLQQFINNPHAAPTNNIFDSPSPSFTPTPSAYAPTPTPTPEPSANLNPLGMFDEQPTTNTPETNPGEDDLTIIEY